MCVCWGRGAETSFEEWWENSKCVVKAKYRGRGSVSGGEGYMFSKINEWQQSISSTKKKKYKRAKTENPKTKTKTHITVKFQTKDKEKFLKPGWQENVEWEREKERERDKTGREKEILT